MQQEDFIKSYDQFADALFRHCYFRVFNKERAEELVQEVFMKTWDYITQGKQIQNMRAFLYKVANNLVIDEARKHKEQSLEVLQEAGFEPHEHISPHEQEERIMAVHEVKKYLDQLPSEDQDVVVMRYIDELPPREIAEALGVTPDVVSVRIHRAMKKLQLYGKA